MTSTNRNQVGDQASSMDEFGSWHEKKKNMATLRKQCDNLLYDLSARVHDEHNIECNDVHDRTEEANERNEVLKLQIKEGHYLLTDAVEREDLNDLVEVYRMLERLVLQLILFKGADMDSITDRNHETDKESYGRKLQLMSLWLIFVILCCATVIGTCDDVMKLLEPGLNYVNHRAICDWTIRKVKGTDEKEMARQKCLQKVVVVFAALSSVRKQLTCWASTLKCLCERLWTHRGRIPFVRL